ncbi:MAG: fumarylacetoacetate hydrolase family protein [Planctomycetota bacterium]
MKLVSFGDRGLEHPGLVIDDKFVFKLHEFDPDIPPDMTMLLKKGVIEQVREILKDREHLPEWLLAPIDKVRLSAPVPHPGQIICVGLNYKSHADEQNKPYPPLPMLFSKAPNASNGPFAEVKIPGYTQQADYEVELGVVIGERARKVAAADYRKYVLGYVTFNDFSCRDAQRDDKQFFRSKSPDGFAPFGPWIVTDDEIADPMNLAVRCKVNGELRQQSNTADLIHPIGRIIEFITEAMTLEPGDIISTGTPGGVGEHQKPPRFLKPGDVVETTVEGIGTLRNVMA